MEAYIPGGLTILKKRIEAHNAGKGAKYTKSRRPVKLLYYEEFDSREEAMRREYEIKHMSRKRKKKSFNWGRGFSEKPPSPIEVYPHYNVYNTNAYITIKWQALPPMTNR